MTVDSKSCLDHRVERISSMLMEDALFQAGALIAGGRRCSSVRGCGLWCDCAKAHEALGMRLAEQLAPAN